jgi:hypothetical protein
MGSIHEKKPEVKISCYCPFKKFVEGPPVPARTSVILDFQDVPTSADPLIFCIL